MTNNYRFILFVLFLITHVQLSIAQKRNNVWCFGDSAGLDFNTPIPHPGISAMDCRGTCVSICDTDGSLLFYAHTSYQTAWANGWTKQGAARNRSHQVMINGDSLIGDGWFQEYVIIPQPGNDSLFYLFELGVTLDQGLYYSLINPYYNNYTGKVLQRNIPILLPDSDVADASIAIKHGNGHDWWYITRNWQNSNAFYVFLITSTGITLLPSQHVGYLTSTDSDPLTISKDGTKICLTNTNGLIETFHFDRYTGIISISTLISPEFASGYKHYYGSAFSPNGNLLYVSNADNIFGDTLCLFQYDLTSSNPAASRQRIYVQQVPASGGILRRGPDDKIYFACLWVFGFPYSDTSRNVYNENLGVIKAPDQLAPFCDFQPFSFSLGGKRCYWGLPNNPDYDMGPLINDVSEVSLVTDDLIISPNPCSNFFTVQFKDSHQIRADLTMYNSVGQLVVVKIVAASNYFYADVSSLPVGVYFIRLTDMPGEIFKMVIFR